MAVGFEKKNICSVSFAFKIFELCFVFIVWMLYRLGNKGHLIGWGLREPNEDLAVIGNITAAGYFFFTVITITGMIFGDKAKIQNLLFNLFGFCFYISVGIVVIVDYDHSIQPLNNLVDSSASGVPSWDFLRANSILNLNNPTFFSAVKPAELALGSMSIITACIFFADTLYSVFSIIRSAKK